jgi:diguanylate cyclase (GGDEF)-like protein
MNSNTRLEDKLFNIILFVNLFIATINVIENIIIKFPFSMNIKWIIVIILCLLIIKFRKYQTITYYLRFSYFVTVILVILPLGWIESGGSANNAITYAFLIMIATSFFFKELTRDILVFLLIITFETLLYLEYSLPEIIIAHSEKTQFIDRFFQVPLVLIIGYLLLRRFADAYIWDKEELFKYSEELKKANNKLEFLANKDVLTESYNRRIYNLRIEEIFSKQEFIKQDICLILFDIDNFKGINDSNGHLVGDRCLCSVAREAEKNITEKALISRWGGDEFAIIFYGDLEKSEQYMINLQSNIRKIEINEETNLTISSGITLIKDNDTVLEVFKRIDSALYESKNKGKNQYTII